MKKIIVLFIAVILAVSLYACSADPGASVQPASSAPGSTQAFTSVPSAVPANASQTPQQSEDVASPTAKQTEDTLDDINASLNNLGSTVDNLETADPADLQN